MSGVHQETAHPAAGPRAHPGALFNEDRRAEDRRRAIFFEPDRIVIKRTVCGMAMRVTVPIDRYRGLRYIFHTGARGGVYRVMLDHADPELGVILFESADSDLADAALSEWTRFFALAGDGGCDPGLAAPTPHGLQLAEALPAARRRGATLAKRRPRLFARRQVGRLARMAVRFIGEAEIIARS